MALSVWHVDTVGAPRSVDGIATGLWLLAAAQQRAGADVTLFVRTPVTDEGDAIVAESGLRVVTMSRHLSTLPRSPIVEALRQRPPDLVHFHAGWVPFHPALAAVLRHRRVRYVHTPHGAYAPALRASKRAARDMYVRLVEAPYVRHAAGVLFNVDGEATQLRALIRGRLPMADTVPFPLDIDVTPLGWDPDTPPTVVFLGRFDVFHKGLDRLAEVARLLPEVSFDAYGVPAEKGDEGLAAVEATAPPNLTFNPPIFGDEKVRRLATASLYLQLSRYDGFPLSVAEAMLHGVPCAVADELAVARDLTDAGAGVAVPTDPSGAAAAIRSLLADRRRLDGLSSAGMAFARHRFDAARSAAAHLSFYERALSR